MMITVTRDDKSFILYRNGDYMWSVEVHNPKDKSTKEIVRDLSQYEMLEELQQML
jgi:hypothetical protein